MEQNYQPQPPEFNRPLPPAAPQYQPRVTASPMMDPVTAIKTCFKKYFDFKGRARRSEFWWFMLFLVVVSSVLTFLSGLVPAISYLSALFSLAVLIPELSALTRRLHDTGRSGWWVALIALFVLGFYGTFGYILGPNLAMMGDIDPLGMAELVAGAIQGAPAAATVMACCSLGTLLLSIIILIFAILDSKWNANKYGPSPKYS